jgi:hypothetical protein
MARQMVARAALAALLAAVPTISLPAAPTTVTGESRFTCSKESAERPPLDALEIVNTTFELTRDARLAIRFRTTQKLVIGDKGSEGTVEVTAWPRDRPGTAPVYVVSVPDASTVRLEPSGLILVTHDTSGDLEWYSTYASTNGRHLFDSHVPVLTWFDSANRYRFFGLYVPADGKSDVAQHVVAEIVDADPSGVVRRYVIRAEDAARAEVLRSLVDAERRVAVSGLPGDKSMALLVRFTWYPNIQAGTRNDVTFSIPVVRDGLDVARAKVPPGFQISVKP